MSALLDSILLNESLMIFIYVISILLILIIVIRFYLSKRGYFGEGNIYKILKKLYLKNDYPYIKQIILPINKQNYVYYDAIVFGDYFIYIIEVKNHNGRIIIDPLDDWIYVDSKETKYTINNP
ncbi:MAG: nuclease-related domain-containing protein, partial [Bacilli bacterium]